jgi:acyl carrier protein
MGLDTVEIILRTEETFSITLPDQQCEQVRTVGDLYRLVLQKLSLRYQPATEIEAQHHGRDRSRIRLTPIIPFDFTPPDVWVTLKALIVDQLQIDPGEVQESAAFQQDLGCD